MLLLYATVFAGDLDFDPMTRGEGEEDRPHLDLERIDLTGYEQLGRLERMRGSARKRPRCIDGAKRRTQASAREA
jgi:hypothetical protein